MAENGYLLTGLGQLPNDQLDPITYAALTSIHMAIRNLDTQLELALGLIKYDSQELDTVYLTGAYNSGKLNRIYVLSVGGVSVGSFVYLTLSGGVTKCGPAIGSAVATMAVGICTAIIGSYYEITIGMGLITGIFVGLTTGTWYWLSNAVAGAMVNARPAGGAGVNKQPVGFALDATTFSLNVSAYQL